MNQLDENTPRSAPQQTWAAALLSDPNAALLASLTPAPERTLESLFRGRVSALSLEALAKGLHRGLPSQFRSRKAAERGILGAIVGVGVAIGALIYLGATSMSTRGAVASAPALSERMGSTLAGPEVLSREPALVQHAGHGPRSAQGNQAANDVRLTDVAQNAGRESFNTALHPQQLHPQQLDRQQLDPQQVAPEQGVASLEPSPPARSPKAKRAAWKKKSKAAARRAAQKRKRARLASQ